MNFVNVWLGLREEAQDSISNRVGRPDDVEDKGLVTDREFRLFNSMADRDVVQNMFKTSSVSGKSWTLWSLSITESPAQVKIELDKLVADRPDHVLIAGAWLWDGRQVGTEFVFDDVTRNVQIDDPDVDPPMVDDPDRLDEDPIPQIVDPDFKWPQITIQVTSNEIVGVSGTPTYPIPATALLRFMPDRRIFSGPDNDIINTAAATELTDVNLEFGQSPRRFES